MISWIQTYFQKHFRLVFAVLLAVTIISFIFTIGAAPGIGRAGNKLLERQFFGHNLGNQAEASRIMRDGSFSAQLKGAFQASAEQVQQFALTRVAGLALADSLHLPVPTEKEVAAFIATLPVFKDAQGNFDQTVYGKFADSLKNNPQFTTADANRVLRDDARLETLSKLLGGPGYVLPADVQTQLTRADSSWSVAVASWDYAAYDAGIAVTEDALKKFYDDNSFRYEVQPRVKATAVAFPAGEFMPQGSPTEEQLRAYYNANPARFPAPAEPAKDAKAPSLALDASKPAATDAFPKVRAQVEAALRQESAVRNALKAANEFTVALYERKLTANSAELTAFVTSQRRPSVALAPFAPDTPPADAAWLGNYSEQVARLNKERYFSDPLPSADGVVVLFWNDTLPAYKPILGEVREKVAADYKDGEKRKRFVESGKTLRSKLEAAVKAGTAFEKAAADQKLEVKSYANFTLRQPPQDMPYAAFGALQNLNAGQVADMIATGDKGYFVYAAQKKLPDLSPSSPRYAEIREQLMKFTAAANESALLGAMVEAELKKSEPLAPGAR
ncbi:MAG: peptidyl-prolyl cis-trans isomerase [Opitutae bacterium]|nr:peptidyl-prolyl cis-trans isomerase [Opitutae bacterium]